MGLIYVFPVSAEETDFVDRTNEEITLKSYGLPYVFWIYAVCVILVVGIMFFAIKAPVLKLVALGDETDALLGYSLLSMIALSPVAIMAFFFYEKRIIRRGANLFLEHRVFGLRLLRESYELQSNDELSVEPFLDSPNVARMNRTVENAGFQNKGYFVLYLKQGEKKIAIDRHSRKVDLEKLRTLLTQ